MLVPAHCGGTARLASPGMPDPVRGEACLAQASLTRTAVDAVDGLANTGDATHVIITMVPLTRSQRQSSPGARHLALSALCISVHALALPRDAHPSVSRLVRLHDKP